MTDIKKYLTISTITLVILYACFAFIFMTWNASYWTENERMEFVFILLCFEIGMNVCILITER